MATVVRVIVRWPCLVEDVARSQRWVGGPLLSALSDLDLERSPHILGMLRVILQPANRIAAGLSDPARCVRRHLRAAFPPMLDGSAEAWLLGLVPDRDGEHPGQVLGVLDPPREISEDEHR